MTVRGSVTAPPSCLNTVSSIRAVSSSAALLINPFTIHATNSHMPELVVQTISVTNPTITVSNSNSHMTASNPTIASRPASTSNTSPNSQIHSTSGVRDMDIVHVNHRLRINLFGSTRFIFYPRFLGRFFGSLFFNSEIRFNFCYI